MKPLLLGGSVAFLLFAFFVTPVRATSYCGKTSGTEQGGFTGNTANITVNVQNGQRFTNPDLTISGTVTSVLGVSQWAVDSLGRCTSPPGAGYEQATIGPVRVQFNGDFESCATSGVSCSRNAARSRVNFTRQVTLQPGANTIHIQAHHAYDRYFINQGCNAGGILCMLGTRSDPAIRDITVYYDSAIPSPTPVNLSVQCGASQNVLTWGALPAGSTMNELTRQVNGGTPAIIDHRLPLSETGYTDTSVQAGATYRYTFKNCAGLSCISNEVVCAQAVASGRIAGVCEWAGGQPQVRLWWSSDAPVGWGTVTTNVLEKGDSFPSDPTRYWASLPNDAALYAYVDSSVQLNTQYQYRVKYRPDLASTNIHSVFVSAALCGGPPSLTEALSITPAFQNVKPNVAAILTATGGDGIYTWEAPDGVISGSGVQVAAFFTNAGTSSLLREVTVRSGSERAIAQVQVDGILTLSDAIDLTATGGGAFVRIADGATTTMERNVQVSLSHGFTGVATSSVTMRLSTSRAGLAAVSSQPFTSVVSAWDLCSGSSSCGGGVYGVFASFSVPGEHEQAAFDSIVYTGGTFASPASIVINDGNEQTADRTVRIALWHGFDGVRDGDVLVQLANRADLLSSAYPFPYRSSAVWDLCLGSDASCPNGTRTIFARFIHVPDGRFYDARDSIRYDSPWPDWGVRINDDALTTETTDVQLQLNPVFARSETTMLVSNYPDLIDALSVPFLESFSWDLCAGVSSPCGSGSGLAHSVFVRFENLATSSWPGTRSPTYKDDIIVGGIPTPPPGPAAVLINEGAATTSSRYVILDFTEPFGGGGVSMRPANEQTLTQRDRDLVRDGYTGGLPGQFGARSPLWVPSPARLSSPAKTVQSSPIIQRGKTLPVLDDPGLGIGELESAAERTFVPRITDWDLCNGDSICSPGEYTVFVQYYKRAAAVVGVPGVFAAADDLVSQVYFDTVQLGTPTPTPTLTPTASPTTSPTATSIPGATPISSPIISPEMTTSGTGPLGILSWVLELVTKAIQTITRAAEPAQSVVVPLSVASATAVAVSAAVAASALASGSSTTAMMSAGWQWFMGLLGLLPKRKKVWGTVYDARTKRPIPFVRVQLMDRNRRVLEMRIADKDGRYGFLTTPESLHSQNLQISITPAVSGYTFPSHTGASIDTFIYSNLYYGDLITVSQNTLVNFDIPMDPLKPAAAPLIVTSPSIALGAMTAAVADTGFWLGLIIVPLNFILAPNPFSLGTLFLFFGAASLRIWGVTQRPFGTVVDAQTGRPMPFALVTLNNPNGRRVAFAVSDERGRWVMTAQKATYELAAVTPATIQPSRQSRVTIKVKKGWITREIKL